MFELPEYLVLAGQMETSLAGERVRRALTKNVPHKFVWHNRPAAEFDARARGLRVGRPRVLGRWLSLPLEPGYVLLFGECGGILRYEEAGSAPPDTYHLLVEFESGALLWARTAMWGAYELYEAGRELERQYVKDQRPTPIDPRFTWEYFAGLLAEVGGRGKRSAKFLLTQEQLIPGLGNAIAQDILFEAGIEPRRDLASMIEPERRALYRAIREKIEEVTRKGGRNDETDLHGRPGGYVRIMDKAATRRPCPRCGGPVSEAKYLGGAVYWCPSCQR